MKMNHSQSQSPDSDDFINDIHWIKKTGWCFASILAALPLIGMLAGGGLWYWAVPLVFGVILPIADHLIGEDPTNVNPGAEARLESSIYYSAILWIFWPLQTLVIILSYHLLLQGGLQVAESVGLLISMLIVSGFGLNLGHELGHHRNRIDRIMAWLMTAPTSTSDFYIYHNYGHHRDVSTPEDPGSSRYGESLWAFWMRSIPGKTKNAWRIEAQRLRVTGQPLFSWHNRFIVLMLPSFIWLLFLVGTFGWWAAPLFVLQYLVARTFLVIADYIEHYGLARRRLPSGDYEPVRPIHSWNNNFLISNLVMCQVNRHSDHHADPERPYQILRHLPQAPQLPSGYLPMMFIAMIPPLWHAIMAPRLEKLYANSDIPANRG